VPEQLIFEHASGDLFVARSKSVVDFGVLYDEVYPVKFRIGVDGRVKEVGVRWEESLRAESLREDKIWFRRTGDGSES